MNFGKRIIGCGLIVLLVMMLIPEADARPWMRAASARGENGQNDFQPQRQGRGMGPGYGRGGHRQQGEARGMRHRGPRLSPEERSQLRRDIRDAGREIYHPGCCRR